MSQNTKSLIPKYPKDAAAKRTIDLSHLDSSRVHPLMNPNNDPMRAMILEAFLGEGFKRRIAATNALPKLYDYNKAEGVVYDPNWQDDWLPDDPIK